METDLQKRVLKIPVQGIENAFIAISARWANKERDGITKNMSFFYVVNEVTIVEWEPEHGPITVIHKCDKEWSDDYSKAKKHWYFDYCTGYGDWAQLAVDENGMHEKYVYGDYEGIFRVLSKFN